MFTAIYDVTVVIYERKDEIKFTTRKDKKKVNKLTQQLKRGIQEIKNESIRRYLCKPTYD